MAIIRPQPGPQTLFLASSADIAIYGGAAGSGKSYALAMEASRHTHDPFYGATIFRRTTPEITDQGGLWDTAMRVYPLVGGRPLRSRLEFVWSNGARVAYRHLEKEYDVHKHQGGQIPLIGFDELTHFTKYQFWYMVSRNRSVCGVKPYMRCTTNPDPDSWVAELIDWWIGEDGYPILERSGVLRWFARPNGDDLIWANSREELVSRYPKSKPMSLTFISAKLSDNPLGDPEYESRLLSLPLVERERLLHGNWKIRHSAGLVFKRSWFGVASAAPAAVKTRVIAWDFAATRGGGDWTVAVVASKDADGRIWIEHVQRVQASELEVEHALVNLAKQFPGAQVAIPQDPGQAGKGQAQRFVRLLHGIATARAYVMTGSKEVRAGGISAQAEAGNVMLVDGPWIGTFLGELERFPSKGIPDDQVDALSLADQSLTAARSGKFEMVLL